MYEMLQKLYRNRSCDKIFYSDSSRVKVLSPICGADMHQIFLRVGVGKQSIREMYNLNKYHFIFQ